MHRHSEQRRLPHSQQQMFSLVADVESYPEFLPWCIGARVFRHEGDAFYADLVVGFRMLREKFTSKVELREPERIDVTYLDGPLKHLHNCWIFLPDGDDACIIDFEIEFQFRSRMFQKLAGTMFTEAVNRMVKAFEKRAGEIYA